jgi:electron-transferring-flavoprotein dehydrogenase
MKSGMLAAECVFKSIQDTENLDQYNDDIKNSWIAEELQAVRNIRPGFQKGLWLGLANAGLISYITRGKEPWTMGHHADNLSLKFAADSKAIDYPSPDGKISFDRLSSVHLSNTNHEENQPAHLTLKDQSIPIKTNLALYDAPEQRYCPAQVYEIEENEAGEKSLRINAQNCVHCKTCDIKDPTQNIVWTPPEGGGGPLYSNM